MHRDDASDDVRDADDDIPRDRDDLDLHRGEQQIEDRGANQADDDQRFENRTSAMRAVGPTGDVQKIERDRESMRRAIEAEQNDETTKPMTTRRREAIDQKSEKDDRDAE